MPLPPPDDPVVFDIVDTASRRTERRGEKYLNLESELLAVVQEFAKRYHWFWRRKTFTFNTVPGQATYDISLQTANGGTLPEIDDFEQFVYDGFRLFRSAADYHNLTPIFDIENQDLALENEIQGEPASYLMEPGELTTVRLTPIPSGVYKIRGSYWAVPQTISPLPVPFHFRPILITGLEAEINRLTLSDGDPAYIATKNKYEEMVARANSVSDYMRGRRRDYADHSGEAIQGY